MCIANIMLKSVSKIDTSGRISFSPKLREFLKVEKGDYITIIEENGKLVIYKFTG